MCSNDIFLGCLAILFPPLAVWVKTGICSADSLINILLCCLGFLPGLLHAWYIIARFPEQEYERLPRVEEGHQGRRVVYVVGQPAAQQPLRVAASHNYGAVAPTNAPTVLQESNGTWPGGESSGGAAPPPTYSQAVGDHKVQTK